VRLGVGGVNAFKGAGTRNVQAYEAYLQGASSRLTDMKAAQRLFYRAIELDPNYAAAWSQRGLVTASSMWRSLPEEAPAILDGALSYVARAVELDPDSAQAHSLFGTVRYAQLDWIAGHEAHLKALSLLADRPTLEQHGNLLMRTGRLEAAAAQFEAARAVEPMDGRPAELAILLDIAQGRFAEAREILSRHSGQSGNKIELDLAINERDPEGVRRALSRLERVPTASEVLYSPVLAEFESRAAVLATLRSVSGDDSVQWPTKLHEIAMLAAYFGDPELALEAKGKEARWTPVRLFAAWYPIMAEARALPAFKTLVADLNLVEYWRAHGWADACRPVGDTDFACR
jgi:tetratricopeptide (TPR) repeat protein